MTSSDPHLRRQIEHYRRHAGDFDRCIWSLGGRENRNHRIKIEALIRVLAPSPGDVVLEVGTGTGLHAEWLAERSEARYVGLDASEDMIRRARVRVSAVPLLVSDAASIPLAGASVDAAFCSGTLHHMVEPWRAVEEMARVTRPGGRVAAMEPNWKFPSHFLASVLRQEERNSFRVTPRSLVAWMENAGLTDVRLERLLYTPPRPGSLARTFDRIDEILARTPGLCRWSIMLLASGRRA